MFKAAEQRLKTAADSGDIHSSILYAERMKDTDPAEAKACYQQAWEAGEVGALARLAKLVEPDAYDSYEAQVEAYAVQYAASAAYVAWVDGIDESAPILRIREAAVASLMELDAGMPAAMVSDVYRQTRSVLSENEMCCIF